MKEKVEYCIRRFRSPFVEDPHISSVKDMLEESYTAGQCLAAEVDRLREALTEISRLKYGIAANEIARAALGEKK